MESFQWDSCFVTGIVTVDEQHRHLVDVINRFGEVLTQQAGASTQDIAQVLGELTDYARYHFSEEEGLMARRGVDPRHTEPHCGEHTAFLEEVTRMQAGMHAEAADAAESLLKFLVHWLAYHILGSDQVLARQLSIMDAGTAAAAAYTSVNKDVDPSTEALLRAVNGLFHQLSQRNRALHELNQTLESRVTQRTQELSAANQRLEDLAMTDVLTGLPNRRHGMLRLRQEWLASVRDNTPLSCMMVDADHFKTINDTNGHDAGDEVLRQLSRALLHGVRTDDMVCRLGGDEFLIICARTPLDGAIQLANKLRLDVAQLRVPAGNTHWHGSISMGVAVRSASMQSIDELIKEADANVYVAKKGGRNRVAASCSA